MSNTNSINNEVYKIGKQFTCDCSESALLYQKEPLHPVPSKAVVCVLGTAQPGYYKN